MDSKIFKQKEVQYPIIFPTNKTIFLGRKSAGKKNIEITTIPVKKNIENNRIFIINAKNYKINSLEKLEITELNNSYKLLNTIVAGISFSAAKETGVGGIA